MTAVPPTDRLLTGKLRVPVTTAVVTRPRLIERIESGLRRPLTVVLAPAGSGKSTLLSDWARATSRTVAWLSLDESDNDPVRFLTYLTAALNAAAPGLGESTRRLLDAAYPPGPTETMALLVEEIDNDATSDLVLVIDDIHLIDEPAICEALTYLIDRMPPRLRLLVAGRGEPDLPLPRLRARNQLSELRADDLRFLSIEASALLADLTGETLAESEIATLTERTEGWAAGLVLAGLSLQGRIDRAALINHLSGSHRFVVDYLVSDVLSCHADATGRFLIQTSILDRLSAPLCDAVLGEDGTSQAMLETIERANLFLRPLDDERRWYRYHQLFAEALRDQLMRREPSLVPHLHRRAADWYLRDGCDADALRHLLAIPDASSAAAIIERHALAMVNRGEVKTLRAWIEALPETEIQSRPRLSLCHAWTLAHTNALAHVEPRLESIEAWLAAQTDLPDRDATAISGEIAAIRSRVAAIRGDIEVTIAQSKRALALTPESDLPTRAGIALSLGGAYTSRGDIQAAEATYAQIVDYGRAAGPLTAALALRYRADLALIRGKLSEADRLYGHALALIEEHEAVDMPAKGIICDGLAELAYLRNDLVTAERLAKDAIARGEAGGEVLKIAVPGWLTLARVLQARGEPSAANDAIDRAICLSNWAHLRAWRARLWLSQGNLASASAWVRELAPRSPAQTTFQYEIEDAIKARVALAEGRTEDAIAQLQRLLTTAERAGRTGRVIEFLTPLAIACATAGDQEGATAYLTRALELAHDERQVRVFLDEGAALAPLLARVRAQTRRATDPSARRLGTYADDLLAALASELPENPTPNGASTVLIEPLSDREREVLRLLAAGGTNREIADELYVSLGTVKAHTNHVFAKLGVRGRTEAAARARELGLLDEEIVRPRSQ